MVDTMAKGPARNPTDPNAASAGNGHCTRPPELDCAYEAICENCSFFQTSIEFRPTLQAQHNGAEAKGQHRADLFGRLLDGLTEGEAS